MRVLVCGGRNLDPSTVWNWLEANAHEECCDRLNRASHVPVTYIIQGASSGADAAAEQWARSSEIPILRFPADWRRHGKAAGPIRNREMLLEGRPDVVIAFPGGRGTADMVRQAEAAGVPVIRAAFSAHPASSSQSAE